MNRSELRELEQLGMAPPPLPPPASEQNIDEAMQLHRYPDGDSLSSEYNRELSKRMCGLLRYGGHGSVTRDAEGWAKILDVMRYCGGAPRAEVVKVAHNSLNHGLPRFEMSGEKIRAVRREERRSHRHSQPAIEGLEGRECSPPPPPPPSRSMRSLDQIQSGGASEQGAEELRREMQDLRRENEALKNEVRELRQKLEQSTPSTGASASTSTDVPEQECHGPSASATGNTQPSPDTPPPSVPYAPMEVIEDFTVDPDSTGYLNLVRGEMVQQNMMEDALDPHWAYVHKADSSTSKAGWVPIACLQVVPKAAPLSFRTTGGATNGSF